ncbi:MAG TPA: hypothetical protein VFG95_02445 [Nitrospiria bacterium]|nr:hypothetical protein [Nitrospiria bacterium]
MRESLLSLILIGTFLAGIGEAAETRMIVRAKSKDAKFIGNSMGGAWVVIRESETGKILAKGLTQGGTGDTRRIMVEPGRRGVPLSDPTAAKYEAKIDIAEPLLVTVEVQAPYGQRQSTVKSSTQIWLIPGKDLLGDGVILEVPGIAIDILSPPTPEQATLVDQKAVIPIRANVAMMCGCPIEPEGLWDAKGYEVGAIVKRDNKIVQTVPLVYAGKRSTFEGRLETTEKGLYELVVYAYNASTGNSGVDRATVEVK